jgi:hypothetical protein
MSRALRDSLANIRTLVLLPAFAASFLNAVVAAQGKAPSFRVIALAEHGGIHKPFVDAAKIWNRPTTRQARSCYLGSRCIL